MRQLFLASLITAGAATSFFALHTQSAGLQEMTAYRSEQLHTQTVRLEQMRTERGELQQQVDDARQNANTPELRIRVDDLAEEFAKSGLKDLSPEQAERLRAELGFNWNSLPDYVIVSKKSLPKLSLTAIRDGKLTDAARAALVVTPEEQAAIEAELQRVDNEYNTWALAHTKREEPSGDVVAKYVLPADPQSSNTLQSFSAVVRSALNSDERDRLFFQFSWHWGDAHQLTVPALEGWSSQTTMVVRRSGNSLMLDLKQPNSSLSSSITPSQPFPEGFLPLFPGGWQDLAQREGFELPKEFQKKQTE